MSPFSFLRAKASTSARAQRLQLTVEQLENRLVPTGVSSVLLPAFYQDLLNRAPDAGAAGYANQLDQGVPGSAVAYEIETAGGNEFRLNVVANDYQHLLHRQGSPAELIGWANQLAAGATQQQVEAMIAGSQEYFALHGSTTQGFLNALYNDALGRPNSEGAWVSAVNQGTPRQDVALAVFTSPEGSLHQVLADYEQYLGRSGVGDPGATAFASALAQGVSHETIVAELLGSAEYLALHEPPGGTPSDSPNVDTSQPMDNGNNGAAIVIVPTDTPSSDTGTPVTPVSPPDCPPPDTGSTDTTFDPGPICDTSDPGTVDDSGTA
jgi:hypothetical protein